MENDLSGNDTSTISYQDFKIIVGDDYIKRFEEMQRVSKNRGEEFFMLYKIWHKLKKEMTYLDTHEEIMKKQYLIMHEENVLLQENIQDEKGKETNTLNEKKMILKKHPIILYKTTV